MLGQSNLSCVILLLALTLLRAQIVPIYPSQTNTIRIFCYSHQNYLVSFNPNTKCALDCGYVQGLESCCIDLAISHSQEIYCYRSSNKTNFVSTKSIQFSATIIETDDEVHQVTNQSQSVLSCLSDTKNTTHSSNSVSADDQFYFKFAYLFDGFTDKFGTFHDTVRTLLPANEETVDCNGTNYKFDYVPDCGYSVELTNHVGTLKDGQDRIGGKLVWSIVATIVMVCANLLFVLLVLYYARQNSLVRLTYKEAPVNDALA